MKKFFIGIDVSKLKLDICLMSENKVVKEIKVVNDYRAVMSEIERIKDEFEISNEDLLICAEHTSQYTYPLRKACEKMNYDLCLENPTQIKYSIGMTRGKNDRVDAHRIAEYASRYEDRLRITDETNKKIEHLKQLEAERTLYLIDKCKYEAQLKDQKDYMDAEVFKYKSKRLKKQIALLQESIDEINMQMQKIVDSSDELRHQMELLMSIPGVGPILALNMIIYTQGFKRFESKRQFCCYAGVAPFQYTSGSSQHSKKKVSNRANKYIKQLLHMSAMGIIAHKKGELYDYYLRKVDEGKNKMTVINAMRAKLIARMFAVIKKDTYYYSAA